MVKINKSDIKVCNRTEVSNAITLVKNVVLPLFYGIVSIIHRVS